MQHTIFAQPSSPDHTRQNSRPPDFQGYSLPDKQYSLTRILMIWLAVTLPNIMVMWVIVPFLIPLVKINQSILFWILILACLVWQFVLSVWILRRETGSLRWKTVKERLWLHKPVDPKTGKGSSRLFWWVVPCILFNGIVTFGLAGILNGWITKLFPGLTIPAYADMTKLLSPEYKGQWWLLGFALLQCLFNYILGEELIFRGILLPKMKGVFKKYDWVANAVLFGLYHLHKPWTIPSLIVGALAFCWPVRRFKSMWMSCIIHGTEGSMVILFVFAAIFGLK
jgi:membrane protease YdiL (CAAX protease family)